LKILIAAINPLFMKSVFIQLLSGLKGVLCGFIPFQHGRSQISPNQFLILGLHAFLVEAPPNGRYRVLANTPHALSRWDCPAALRITAENAMCHDFRMDVARIFTLERRKAHARRRMQAIADNLYSIVFIRHSYSTAAMCHRLKRISSS